MTGQLCTALADDVRVGIPTDDVRELVRDRDVTPIPLADVAVRGLMNLRGDLVIVLDLRVLLGRAPHPAPTAAVHVVLRGTPVRSLLVDAIGEIVSTTTAASVAVPSNIAPDIGRIVDGAVAADGDTVLMLDTERAAAVPEPAAGGQRTTSEEPQR